MIHVGVDLGKTALCIALVPADDHLTIKLFINFEMPSIWASLAFCLSNPFIVLIEILDDHREALRQSCHGQRIIIVKI